MHVYKSKQLFRIQNSEKINSGRPKKLVKVIGDQHYDKTSYYYFVQYIPDNCTNVNINLINKETKENISDKISEISSDERKYPRLV